MNRANYFLILLLFTLSQKALYSQEIPFNQRYDSVIFQKVQINGVIISGTKRDILNKIGKPQTITRYVSDANDDHWFEYHYDRTILEVLDDGSFYGFKLRTSAFTWQCGAVTLKVGDPLSVLCQSFPASCRTMKAGKSDVLRLRLQGTDAYIHFLTKNNIITSIETWQEL
jgi:hypothetical protein